MANTPIDWTRLDGRSLQTTTGAEFKVVRVTARSVTVRPERASRNYALSIPNELERAVAAYQQGRFFPSPADLQRPGSKLSARDRECAHSSGAIRGSDRNGTVGAHTEHRA